MKEEIKAEISFHSPFVLEFKYENTEKVSIYNAGKPCLIDIAKYAMYLLPRKKFGRYAILNPEMLEEVWKENNLTGWYNWDQEQRKNWAIAKNEELLNLKIIC